MRNLLTLFGTLTLAFGLPACEIGDLDGDDYLAPTDCDDDDASVHPGAEELEGDQIDNDCDGLVDCEDDDLQGVYEGDVGEAELAGLCEGWCGLTIQGSVTLDQTALTDLDALSCVTSVVGDLYVRENASLTSISGLSALRTVGGDLSIGEYWWYWVSDSEIAGTGYGNPALSSYDGLQNLESVGGWLFLADNDAMVDPGLSFDRLVSVGAATADEHFLWTSGGYGVFIDGHAALTRLPDFPLLTYATGYSEVWDNAALTTLAGLSATQKFDSFYVSYNPALEAPLGLDALEEVTGFLGFIDNGNTTMQGFEALTTVGAGLEFWLDDQLLSLEGLDSLQSVGGQLRVVGMDGLTDLSGLCALTYVGSDFTPSYSRDPMAQD